ncbi:hypothetical protein SAMN05443667_101700 [Flavobacterium gillisiae]|uniref:Uncharacterized protein n=1 Tax=Flavobacterium gillisiae TaxID=150146 RepID=A0A1H3XWI3_9FLAO|nr:hypothetical protein SAMN05443667_101700 [Flavobacterium gillisiae]
MVFVIIPLFFDNLLIFSSYIFILTFQLNYKTPFVLRFNFIGITFEVRNQKVSLSINK